MQVLVDAIKGWGLWISPASRLQELGEIVAVGDPIGCASDACHHDTHSPAAPMRVWIPRDGVVVTHVGHEANELGYRSDHYELRIDGEETLYAVHSQYVSLWSTLKEEEEEELA